LIAVGALLALLVVCGVLLRLLFDPNDYRTQIEAAFKERTARVLELEGHLNLRLLPRLAVSTGPFSISDRSGAGDGDFLTARDARLGLALLPLLQRRVELGKLVLVEPAVALRIDENGRDNWSDLLDRPEPTESPDESEPRREATAPGAPDLSIAGLFIEDGRLSFDDARRSRHLQFVDLDLETGPLAHDSPTSISAGFALEHQDTVILRSVVSGRLGRVRPGVWAAEGMVVEIERPAPSGSEREPLKGRMEAARVTADLDARHYSAPELRYRLGDAKGEANLEARQGAEGLAVEGPVTIERTNLRALLTSLGVTLPQFRDPEAPGDIELKAALRYGSSLALRDLVAVLGGTRLTGNIELAGAPGSPTQFDLRGDRIALDDYMPASPPEAGTDTPTARQSATDGGLRKLHVQGRFAFGRLSYAQMDASNVDGSLEMHNGTLQLDPLRASLFGGTSQTRVSYELAAKAPRLTLDQRLTGVDMAAMLGKLLNQKRLSGRGTLTAQLSGAGRDRKALLGDLAGPFEVLVTDGRFAGVDLWAEIERAIAAARGAVPPRRSGSPSTPFDRFEAQGRLDGTVIRSESFDVANPSMRARGKGTVDYGTGAVDLALTARLLEAPEGEIAGLSLDRIVGVDIPLSVRGSISEPKVRPDTKRLLEAAARQQFKEEGEDVEKKLKKKLEDKLKDLLGQ
jgi:AsmA protein